MPETEIYAGGEVTNPDFLSPKALRHVEGYNPLQRQLNARRMIQVEECTQMWAKFKEGHIDPFLMMEALSPRHEYAFNELQRQAPRIFNEAMTRGDFSNLTTYVLDRLMFANYPDIPDTFSQICKLHKNVRDFRVVERWQTDGGERPWQRVGETSTFNRSKEDTGKYAYQVFKYEQGDQISWEATINDDMEQFTDLPMRLARGGKRTIEQFFLKLIANASGPHPSFFGTAVPLVTGGTIKNIIDTSPYSTGTYTGTNNPTLSVISLILATGIFMNQMTAEGRPIDIATDQLNVMVADGVLYQTLKNIINTNQIATTILGGQKATGNVAADITMMAKNWMSGNINPVYAPELRNIMTSNAGSAWWLFSKPGQARPAIELGFLTGGYDTPQLYRKLPDTVRISGGGTVDEFGSFETMATEVKGLIAFGGTRMDPRMAMASSGVGS